ncbi:MAG TPA: polyprenyl synthetase family protein, partial [Gammaproteobacteria bacterium]|nr:polyprenyl synthetase family protein [Gammaproteobacteria bacterium]
ATNTIAEGEVLQLVHQHNPHTSEQDYLHVIRCKTAKLFEAAAEVAAVLTNATPHIQAIFAQYGLHLGTAYQLIDDLLDYQTTNIDFGKQLGIDLAEGKPTMPLIYLLQHGTAEQQALVTHAITQTDGVDLAQVQEAIVTSGALEYTLAFAKREASLAQQSLAELPDSEHRATAMALAEFVVNRTH